MTEQVLGSVGTVWRVGGPWRHGEFADPDGFADSVDAALTIERRFDNGTCSPDDQRRYDLALRAIERHARSTGERLGRVSADSLQRLAALSPGASRVSKTFFPPWLVDQTKSELRRLSSLRSSTPLNRLLADLFEGVTSGWGCVITIDPGVAVARPARSVEPATTWNEPSPELASRLANPKDGVFEGWRREAFARLREEASRCARRGEPLVVGAAARHDVLTELLREVADHGSTREGLRLAYVDGSESSPFQGGAFKSGKIQDGASLSLGLMSMRHTELDQLVDGYVYRNRMVSLSQRLAETEESCAQQATTLLDDLTRHGVSRIVVYHTGYEPAVVGFYRAVGHWLAQPGTPSLSVQPKYLTGKTYMDGTLWGGDSR